MGKFVIWSRVEATGDGHFFAVASAIPCDTEERCAPEERAEGCASREAAERTVQRLARELSHDIHERGGRVAPARDAQPRSATY